MLSKIDKNASRKKRHLRIRNKISGTAETPRLNIFKSSTHIYAQIIDDDKAVTLVSSSSQLKELAKELKGKNKVEQARVVGNDIANYIATMNINPLLLPFIISTMIRFIQGSGTVAMLTAASIAAPIVIPLGVNPVFATLSACVGSLFFSYFNDSFFWVVNRSLGLTEAKEQIGGYSIVSTIAWAVGFLSIVLLNFIFG